MTTNDQLLGQLRRTLVVSCQAAVGTPLAKPEIIAAMAAAAELGGAAGLRIDGLANIRAVRSRTSLPIIGIIKRVIESSPVYITPTVGDVAALAAGGVQIVAADATDRLRPAEPLRDLIDEGHRSGCLMMADVSTFDEGRRAMDLGADLVATTLRGYLPGQPAATGPAFSLIADLAAIGATVVAEGSVWSPDDVARCFEEGAHAVVVGGAVTDPMKITRRLATGIPTPPLGV